MNRGEAQLNNFIKIGANGISKFLWVCSIWFSVFGLVGTLVDGSPHLPMWLKVIFSLIAVGLGFTVTILELMFNRRMLASFVERDAGDIVLLIFQVLAYIYDGYTNVAGLTFFVLASANFTSLPFTPALAACIFFGLLIAGGPEPIYLESTRMKYIPVYALPKGNQQQQRPAYRSDAPAPAPKTGIPQHILDKIEANRKQREQERSPHA